MVVLLLFVLWVTQRQTTVWLARQIEAAADNMSARLQLRLSGNADFLERLAEERGEGELSVNGFQDWAQRYLADHPELTRIIWLDVDAQPAVVVAGFGTASNAQALLDSASTRAAALQSKSLRKNIYVEPFQTGDRTVWLEVWVPVYTGDLHRGWFVGVYACDSLLKQLVPPELLQRNFVELGNASGQVVCGSASRLGALAKNRYRRAIAETDGNLVLTVIDYSSQHGIAPLLFITEIVCLILLSGVVVALYRLRQEFLARAHVKEHLDSALEVFNHSFDGIVVADISGRVVEVNPAFSRLTGYARDEVIGAPIGEILTASCQEQIRRNLTPRSAQASSWQMEVEGRKKNGDLFQVSLSVSAVRDTEGAILRYIGIASDISLIKQHEKQLEWRAHHDSLTGLPNYLLLTKHIEQAIDEHQNGTACFAIGYVDLDNFQLINDDYSHEIGDQVLQAIAQRMLAALAPADILGHLGGDEFLFMLNGLRDDAECHLRLDKLIAALCAPIAISSFSLQVSASIGLTFYRQDTTNPHRLIRQANQAMNKAKESGKNRVELYDCEREQRVQRRREALARLRQALQQEEFVLYFQPKVDMVEHRVVGAEALIRWQHPERGLVPPAEFLPLIEGSDIEIAVGEWVIENALRKIEHWVNTHELCIPVSVNISANHLLQPNFVESLRLALARHPTVTEHSLEIEIVETAALSDFDTAINVLQACADLGVRAALDDFGTGYSSLSYFQKLPVSVLKIDQSFVRDMHENAADMKIIESVVKLSQLFHRAIIAEGVETDWHIAALCRIGCRYGQGYGIARPMPADELADWVRSWERSNGVRAELTG